MTSGTYQTHKNGLIKQAIDMYKDIYPVSHNVSISADSSFTIFEHEGGH